MPRKTVPSYLLHRSSGQARVRLDGKDHYLGVYGSKESRQEYARLISDWSSRQEHALKAVDVSRLTLLYLEHAKRRYVKHGTQTSEVSAIRAALKFLNQRARSLPVEDVSPRVLKAVRSDMIAAGLARTTVNSLVTRIRRLFRWAVSEEFISPTVLDALRAVPDLRADTGEARETEPVRPVPDQDIEAIRDHVPDPVWSMIELQRWTGMRPGEVIIMRGRDLKMSGEVWEYRPSRHKTEHRRKERVVFINARAQGILRPYLRTDLESFLFSPVEDRSRGYRRDSYTTAIARGCRKATEARREQAKKEGIDPDTVSEIPVWSPNQLRHNFATLARKEFGIEAARVLLGHSSAVTSEIYAERDFDAARAIVAKIG